MIHKLSTPPAAVVTDHSDTIRGSLFRDYTSSSMFKLGTRSIEGYVSGSMERHQVKLPNIREMK
jgi:hypothetical protein